MDGQEEGIITDPAPEADRFVPLKARAYHINQAAIDACNEWGKMPSELIIELYLSRKNLLESNRAKDRMIDSLKSIVPTDGRPVYTLQEFGDVMRKVTQAEGVMLHDKQKGFFQALFASLTQCISDKGLMRK